jgi:hypothetical protein
MGLRRSFAMLASKRSGAIYQWLGQGLDREVRDRSLAPSNKGGWR